MGTAAHRVQAASGRAALVTAAVRGRADAHGIEFVEYSGPLAAELLAERLDAVAVVAGFSTALPTVHTSSDGRSARRGTTPSSLH